jgi:hypothetical protein
VEHKIARNLYYLKLVEALFPTVSCQGSYAEQQARHLRDLLCRQSQSPTIQAIRQLVKGCQLAMNAATMLTEENKRLHALNHRQQSKANQRRQYIACGGALQVKRGQELVVEADRVVVDADLRRPTERRPRTTNMYDLSRSMTQTDSVRTGIDYL